MKKYKLLVMIPAFCLASCSNNNIYGTYTFSMGKEGGTHVRASIEFSQENYSGVEGAKEFSFSVTNGESDSWISQILGQGLNGYYTITKNKDKEYGTRINVGAIINHEHYPDIIDSEAEIDIPTDLIEKVITIYCNSKIATLMLPVSFEDLAFQLVWYGYSLDLSSISFSKLEAYKMPGFDQSKKGNADYETEFLESRIGQHPVVTKDEKGNVTYDQVQEMNNNFAYDFANTIVYDVNTDERVGAVGMVDSDYYYFSDTDAELDTTITQYFGNRLATITIDKTQKSPFDNGYKITSVTKQGSEGTLTLEPEEYEDVFYDPYVFRDFHTLTLGLTKDKGK